MHITFSTSSNHLPLPPTTTLQLQIRAATITFSLRTETHSHTDAHEHKIVDEVYWILNVKAKVQNNASNQQWDSVFDSGSLNWKHTQAHISEAIQSLFAEHKLNKIKGRTHWSWTFSHMITPTLPMKRCCLEFGWTTR